MVDDAADRPAHRAAAGGLQLGATGAGRRRAADRTADCRAAFVAGPYYCAGVERLLDETGSDYYYTRSPRIARCTNVEVVYRSRGIRIVSLSFPAL